MGKFIIDLLRGAAICASAILYVGLIAYVGFEFGDLVFHATGSNGLGFAAMMGFDISLYGGTVIAINGIRP